MTEEAAARRARAAAFEAWSRSDPAMRPEQELLGEHHVMSVAMSAMDEEAHRLLRGSELRPEFWDTVIEVIGRFIHRVHRTKEEQVFFPALCEWGLLEPVHAEVLHDVHGELGRLTEELCDGIRASDWEQVFRVVAIYLHGIRAHLAAEERHLLSRELAEIPEARLTDVREGFRAVERAALGDAGRGRILVLTRQLCRQVGLAELHHEVDTW